MNESTETISQISPSAMRELHGRLLQAIRLNEGKPDQVSRGTLLIDMQRLNRLRAQMAQAGVERPATPLPYCVAAGRCINRGECVLNPRCDY